MEKENILKINTAVAIPSYPTLPAIALRVPCIYCFYRVFTKENFSSEFSGLWYQGLSQWSQICVCTGHQHKMSRIISQSHFYCPLSPVNIGPAHVSPKSFPCVDKRWRPETLATHHTAIKNLATLQPSIPHPFLPELVHFLTLSK